MIKVFSKCFPLCGAVVILILVIIAAPKHSYAQNDGESKFEKIQKDKIKWNRKRLKSQRARRARHSRRSFFNFRSERRGDQPYNGNVSSKFNRSRISPSSTPTVYAQPDPYSYRSGSRGRRKIFPNDGLKRTPRPPAKAWEGNLSGTPARRSPSPSKPKVYAQPDPYYSSGREARRRIYSNENLKRNPSGRAKRWSGGVAENRGRKSPSGRPRIYAQPNPYQHRSGSDRRRNIFPNDNLKLGSPPPAKAWQGDGYQTERRPGGKINVHPQPNPYSHRRMRSEGERISRNQNSYGTSPRSTERPVKRGRIHSQSASGRYTVNRRANPYKLRGQHGWENTYTGGFYGRRGGIKPKNTQRISVSGAPDPYRNRGRLGDKAYSGEITGGYRTTPRNNQKAWRGDIAGRKLRTRSEPRGVVNAYPSVSPYGKRLNKTEADRISRNQDYYGASPRSTERPSRSRRVKVNSASRAYLVRRKAKPYKLRDVKKWEETYTGGFYGRREGINPQNTQRVSSLPAPNPYVKRGRLGDKPYQGKISGGGWQSATKPGETAWKGDIAGRRINYSRPGDTQKSGDRFGITPGASSISGGLHNNQGRAIGSFTPGKGALKATSSRGRQNLFEIAPGFITGQGNYQGDIKRLRPEKGGGSLARNNWNNNGSALQQKYGRDTRITGNYTGNIKTWRPEKGGGSVSRGEWNNQGQPLDQRYDRDARVAGSFSGSIKAGKPEKGGGSLSRDGWNNNGQALSKRYDDKNSRTPGSFSGSLKASKPDKGGESATRTTAWNNNGSAVTRNASSAGKYSGFSGDMKIRKSRYARSNKSDDEAIKVRKPTNSYFAAGSFKGTRKKSRKIEGQTHTNTNFYNSKNETNAIEEKKKIISFKLLWNKLFGKETPEQKSNAREPRYDRKEKGIWYE